MNGIDDKNQVVIVTGGAGGIGLECTRLFLARGARVVAVDNSPERCAELRAAHVKQPLTVVEADLSSADGLVRVETALLTQGIEPTVLVNVAGRLLVKPFGACDRSDWVSMLETNVVGMALMCRLVLPGMVSRGSGSIVNMASLSGHLATPLESVYGVSKAAIIQLTKAIAVEYRRFGIRCNCVSPAMVDTQHGRSEIASLRAAGIPLSMEDVVQGQVRLCAPQEIADVIAFLAGKDSSFVNGTEIVVDHTWSAGAGA
jgi:NAD(P)-dependent dehydrogenase (short-subunit alcohol dehydrogenase family)